MKTKLLPHFLLFVSGLLLAPAILAQPPQGFNYQAVIRDNSGEIISNQLVGLRISILQGSETGTQVYRETHQLNSTAQGLLNLVVGSGSTTDDFSQIDWSNGPYFLKLEADPSGGNSYAFVGTSQLQSVPYALHAESQELILDGSTLTISGGNSVELPAVGTSHWTKNGDTIYHVIGNVGIGTESPMGKLSVRGDNDLDQDKALFEVKRKDGQPVFAVYPDGVEVYVDDAAAKGAKGGFAVAGFGGDKATVSEYLRVSPDSVRVYIDETAAKGAKGGFAIGGLGKTKGPDNNFMAITPENYFIGQQSGRSITTGLYNSFMGYQSGYSTTDGGANIFLGYRSGYSNVDGYTNTFIGNNAGYLNEYGASNVFIGDSSGFSNNGDWNIFIGNQSGFNNSTGWANIAIGDLAGKDMNTGYQNVMIGDLAGYSNSSGNSNVFIGADAGFYNSAGSFNVFLGESAGFNNSIGSSNVFLGESSGASNSTGNSNVFLGTEAGFSNDTGSYNVFLGERAGYSNLYGEDNVFIGADAGENNTSGNYNVFMGTNSGSSNSTGNWNVFIGDESGTENTIGSANVFLGLNSGHSNDNGNYNVFLGTWSGGNNVSGQQNVFLGQEAGFSNESGGYNVAIGSLAGYYNLGFQNVLLGYKSGENNIDGNYNVSLGSYSGFNSIGSYNTFIGYAAGYQGEGWGGQTDNMLWIDYDTNYWDETFIYGEFDNLFLRFFANVEVAGNLTYLGNFGASDRNLKKNIAPMSNSLDKIKQLQGVTFEWKSNANKQRNIIPEGEQIGLIAQEVELVFPNMVKTSRTGEKAVNYTQLTTVLIEAVKEQQQMIEALQAEVEELKSKLP